MNVPDWSQRRAPVFDYSSSSSTFVFLFLLRTIRQRGVTMKRGFNLEDPQLWVLLNPPASFVWLPPSFSPSPFDHPPRSVRYSNAPNPSLFFPRSWEPLSLVFPQNWRSFADVSPSPVFSRWLNEYRRTLPPFRVARQNGNPIPTPFPGNI